MSLYSVALATFLVGTSQHFGLSSTVSSLTVPYEDDPNNFKHQHATGFLCSNSTYYMMNRTYKPPVPSECISVNVTSGLRNGTYQALLRHRFNGSSVISSMNITVRPFTSGFHTEDNALLFNISMKPNLFKARTVTASMGSSEHGGSGFLDMQSAPQPPLYKFMYINSNKTCAVLRATHQQNGKEVDDSRIARTSMKLTSAFITRATAIQAESKSATEIAPHNYDFVKVFRLMAADHETQGSCELFSTGPPPFVPKDCMDVYLNISNCPNTTSEVWKEDCKF